MNRFKKELVRKGFTLACGYEMLPTEIGIQDVIVNSETAEIKIVHTSIITVYKMSSNGDFKEIAWY